jgi:ADP-heptose:LPS heptosyltransferase
LLLIKLDALGDFVLWLAVARGLRAAFPQSTHHITLLGNQLWTDIAQDTSLFEEVWGIERERFRNDLLYRYRNLLRIRNAGFDSVIQAQLSREFFMGDSVIRTCGAKIRIGPRGDAAVSTTRQLRLSDRWYTQVINSLPPTHSEVDRNADFFKSLTGLPLNNPLPSLRVQSHSSRFVDQLSQPFFVLVPGASVKGRMWPVGNYVELARRIASHFRWRCVICGDEAHQPLGAAICREVGPAVIDLTGKTTLLELFDLLSRAKLYVGNETGPAHVATALGIPTVVLLGGGHFGRFFPYPAITRPLHHIRPVHVSMDCFNCDWRCRYVNLVTQVAPCVESIAVETVWQEVLSTATLTPSASRHADHVDHA